MTEYHVHIVTVGFESKPSMDVLSCGIPVDKVYLLNDSTDEKARESETTIEEALLKSNVLCKKVDIDCYDYYDVYNAVLDIADSERSVHPKCHFHINFSRGTAIAVGAVCNAAYEIEAELYYSKHRKGEETLPVQERILRVDLPSKSALVSLKGTTEALFLLFEEGVEMSNSSLKVAYGNIALSSLTYQTSKLENMGLITGRMDGKEKMWVLTGKGAMTLKRMRRNRTL